MPKGNLFVISAPSGTGKTSLVNALVQGGSSMQASVSHTTRSKRSGEVDGVNYFFVDDQAFSMMADSGAMLEYAKVFGASYGTSKEWVMSRLAEGVNVILEIDYQGAAQVRQQYQDAISIFVLPPALDDLQQRLHKRKQDDPETIRKRMSQVREEVAQFEAFDYLVVNDDFDDALRQLQLIVACAGLRTISQKQKVRKTLASFDINV
jgi:guanylate kinase